MSEQATLMYNKLQLGEIQLERALQLFLEEHDYVCAVTLAGAAEEILAKLREQSGGTSELKGLIGECVPVGRHVLPKISDKELTKLFSEVFTYPRNELKHFGDGSSVVILRDAVVPIIGRAVTNYREVTGSQTARMTKFMAENYGL